MMRLSREHALHNGAPLRSFKPQTGTGTHVRGAAPTKVSKVSEAPRPSCAINANLLILTGALSSGECCMHMLRSLEVLH